LTPHPHGPALPVSRRLPASDLRVDTVADSEKFLALEPIWDDLVERARIVHPFLTHAWVRSFLESFGKGRELRILAVFSGQTCIAIAPLVMRRAWKYGVPLRQLELIGNKHTPRSDFIIADRPKEAYCAIWQELERQSADWDVVVLPQLAAGSQTLEEMRQLAQGRALLTGVWTSSASPCLRLCGSWESYFQSRAAKHRSNLRNRLGRLQRLGPVEMEEIAGGSELARALEDGLRIEAAAWKGKNGTAIASQPESRHFYESFAERAAERGWLRLQFLKVGGKRIAFNYCLRFRNTLYIVKQGYDPAYAAYSPFNLLCMFMLQDAFRRGVSAVDFLGCEEPWKRSWTEESHGHSWLYLFQDRWRTRPIHFAKFRVLPAVKSTGFYSAMRAAWQALWAPRQLPQRSR
jgi:CelD/BcsL family acetyltransferase involved in cellulose biosynthesis